MSNANAIIVLVLITALAGGGVIAYQLYQEEMERNLADDETDDTEESDEEEDSVVDEPIVDVHCQVSPFRVSSTDCILNIATETRRVQAEAINNGLACNVFPLTRQVDMNDEQIAVCMEKLDTKKRIEKERDDWLMNMEKNWDVATLDQKYAWRNEAYARWPSKKSGAANHEGHKAWTRINAKIMKELNSKDILSEIDTCKSLGGTYKITGVGAYGTSGSWKPECIMPVV